MGWNGFPHGGYGRSNDMLLLLMNVGLHRSIVVVVVVVVVVVDGGLVVVVVVVPPSRVAAARAERVVKFRLEMFVLPMSQYFHLRITSH